MLRNASFASYARQVKHQGCSHCCQHKKEQPAEIGNHHEKSDASGQEHFRLFFGIPCNNAKPPIFRTGSARPNKLRRRTSWSLPGRFGFHLVLDQNIMAKAKLRRMRRRPAWPGDVHVQPGRLQGRHQRMNVSAQQLHQDDAHDRDRHGDGADDFHFEFLLGDQGKRGESPDEHEKHFVDAGERRMSRLIQRCATAPCWRLIPPMWPARRSECKREFR